MIQIAISFFIGVMIGSVLTYFAIWFVLLAGIAPPDIHEES
ncbi:MAG: hypothetical protein ACREO5_00610 [Candidatus Binatia bacterium]